VALSRPVVGVGAIVVDGMRVLLVRRAFEPLKGQWSLPGGKVELGETLEAATRREVREETGLEIEVGPIVEVLDRIDRAPGGAVLHHFVLVDFTCRPLGGTVCCASDAAEARWVRIDELADYAVAPVTIRVIEKAVARGFTGDRPLVW
jgi:8-oxo-dGTP diphosphatase